MVFDQTAAKGRAMKKKPTLPPENSWDFRQVDPNLLSDATEYEYARTSDKIRDAVSQCLQTKIKGKRICEHIHAALKKEKLTSAKTPWGICSKPFPDCFPAGVYRKASADLLKATGGNFKLRYVIMHQRPDFPAPWVSHPIKSKANRNFSTIIFCTPMDLVFKHVQELAIESGDALRQLEIEQQMHAKSYELKILDWNAPIKGIVKSFEKWLREEMARTNAKMRTGRNAQVAQEAYPLKCLAALRLRRAGFTYDAAACLLQKIAVTKSDAWLIPMFENAPTWTKAIQFAENRLAEINS